MKLTTTQKWRRTLTWLRRNFPAPLPIIVRSVPILKWQGEAQCHSGRQFVIKIDRKQSFDLRIDTIIHEWAHVLTWFGAETNIEDHSAEWGIAYAKIYRTYLKWNFGREGSLGD